MREGSLTADGWEFCFFVFDNKKITAIDLQCCANFFQGSVGARFFTNSSFCIFCFISRLIEQNNLVNTLLLLVIKQLTFLFLLQEVYVCVCAIGHHLFIIDPSIQWTLSVHSFVFVRYA